MINALATNTSGADVLKQALKETTRKSPQTKDTPGTMKEESPASPSTASKTDTVSLSETAKKAMVAANPGSSVGKSFDQVKVDARATLDAAYERKGLKRLAENMTANEVDDFFKGLDRRALYAVMTDTTGAFSDMEKTFANAQIAQEDSQAIVAGREGAYIKLLDSASDEEKQSDRWKMERANAQFGLWLSSREKRRPLDSSLISDDPLVDLIFKARQNAWKKDPGASGQWRQGDRIEDMDFMKPFAAELASLRDAGNRG